MKRLMVLLGCAAIVVVAACANETPEQKHEAGCLAGTVTGAVVGGLVGNMFGGGVGKSVMTAVGAGAGTVAGEKLACG